MKLLFLATDPTVGALPRSLAALGHDVRLAAPLAGAKRPVGRLAARVVARVAVPTVQGEQVAEVYAAKRAGVTVYTLAGPRRKRGEAPLTPAAQAIFFSLAAVGLCRALGWGPDVLHALDASAGAALYWLATDGLHDDLYAEIATVLTVGEVDAPYVGAGRELSAYGLVPSDAPHLPDAARAALLGLGLAHANALTAAGPAQARHLAAPEAGEFAALLHARGEQFMGIAPGLDLAAWDPAHDPALAQRYDAARLERRAANKRALQRDLRLPRTADTPLLALLPALEPPGSLDLALPALRELLWSGAAVQVAVIGPAGPEPAAEIKALARTFPGQVAATRRVEARLLRRVFAGADVTILAAPHAADGLPARQALRYGAVPVAHGWGEAGEGVLDTQPRRPGTGFVFRDYNSGALLEALQRARRAHSRPSQWLGLQRRGLLAAAQGSEAAAAQAHLALYHQAIFVRKETRAQLAGVLAEFPAAG